MVQAAKVLEHMGTNFSCLRREDAARTCGYRERTNVLSYYIVAGALMHDLEKFMGWCARNAVGFIYFKPRPPSRASVRATPGRSSRGALSSPPIWRRRGGGPGEGTAKDA